jgi:protein-disulfide isomerase
MNMIKKVRTWVGIWVIVWAWILTGCTVVTDANLEAKVLEIIEKNPQAILASVDAYQKEQQQASKELVETLKTNPLSIIGQSPTTGSEARNIVLVEFSDFQCPFCAKAHDTLKQFMKEHGNEVTLVYKHLPLDIHPEAFPAAQASWAAGRQNKFWEYHDLLFTNQKKLGDAFYQEAAQQLSLNLEKFNQDRQSPASTEAVSADQKLGETLGITGTPFFLMNGVPIRGAQPLEGFTQVLSQVKAQKG